MLKQLKKKNYKTSKILIKKLKRFKRIRKNFKLTSNIFNPTFQTLQKLNFQKSFVVNIKITSNNIFCTFKNKNKIIYILSAGKSIVNNLSKKTLRYKSQLIIKEFFKNIKNRLINNNFLINIEGTKKIRSLTLRNISNYFKNKKILINVNLRKCFNGCRPPKKRRKRQKGLRIFK